MTTLSKLTQLERAYRKQHKAPARLFVHFAGDDFGTCNGERLSLADWQLSAGDNGTVLKVQYTESIKLQWPEDVSKA